MQCIAGCKVFDGGERKHHPDCPFYPESLTKIYHDLNVENKTIRDLVIGWREHDWPEGFDRRTAQMIADHVEQHTKKKASDG